MAVCAGLLNIANEAFTMKCELCDQQLKEEDMISCTECKKYLCSECVHSWAFQQLKNDTNPSCPFCRTALPMFNLYEQILNRAQTDILEVSAQVADILDASTYLATTPDIWDLPPVSWYAYFGMLGWTASSPSPPPTPENMSGLTTPDPDPYENLDWLDWTPGLIDELTVSDNEFLTTPPGWTGSATAQRRAARRAARTQARLNRRSLRTPRRVRHLLDPVSSESLNL